MSFVSFITRAFTDKGEPSSSRLLTIPTVLTSCAVLVYTVLKTHLIPDGMTLTGLGAFSVSPYAAHRVSKMVGRDKDTDSTVVVDQTTIVKQP